MLWGHVGSNSGRGVSLKDARLEILGTFGMMREVMRVSLGGIKHLGTS